MLSLSLFAPVALSSSPSTLVHHPLKISHFPNPASRPLSRSRSSFFDLGRRTQLRQRLPCRGWLPIRWRSTGLGPAFGQLLDPRRSSRPHPPCNLGPGIAGCGSSRVRRILILPEVPRRYVCPSTVALLLLVLAAHGVGRIFQCPVPSRL